MLYTEYVHSTPILVLFVDRNQIITLGMLHQLCSDNVIMRLQFVNYGMSMVKCTFVNCDY